MKLNQYEWDPEKDLIAQGAFAEVFKAKDTNSQDRFVALKIYKEGVFKGTSGSTGQEKYTLEKEFQKIDGLSHTNIITYFGINYIKHKDALGRSSSYPVIIMEYASEGTLLDLIRTNPDAKTMDKIIQDIIQGVGYLHSEGIIHRDLKPGNILITRNRKGEPIAKITDFGISQDILSDRAIEESFTEGIGTPHYMAPEQFYKKKFGLKGDISKRTDIWALGVVIYRVLTNKLPFGHGSKDYELIRDAITNEEPELKIIPEKYKVLLESCFQKKADKRPYTASDLLNLIGNKEIDDTEKTKRDINLDWETEEETIVNKSSLKENNPPPSIKHTLLEKIFVAIFGVINIGYSLWIFFSTKGTVSMILFIYPIAVLIIILSFYKIIQLKGILKHLAYGVMLFFSLSMGFFFMSFDFFSLNTIYLILTLIVLPIGLILIIKKDFGEVKNNSFFVLFLIASSCILYLLLNIVGDMSYSLTHPGLISLLLYNKATFLLIIPDVFFLTAIMVFLTNKHKIYPKIIIAMSLVSIFIAFAPWLFLNSEKQRISAFIYKYYFIEQHIQDFGITSYLWFFAILIGFSTIIFTAIKKSLRKYYWISLTLIIMTFGFIFYINYHDSQPFYDFKKGIKNLDFDKFKSGLDKGVKTYWEKGVTYSLINQYNTDNAYKIKRMVKLFINHSGLVTFLNDKDLKRAVETNDAELVEILLSSEHARLADDLDFVVDNKSLLQIANDRKLTKIQTLLKQAGAKLTEEEEHELKIKNKFEYVEDFTNISKKFPASSNINSDWSFSSYGNYKLIPKNEKVSHIKEALFDIDVTKSYSVEVQYIGNWMYKKVIEAGLIFDSNGSDFHVMTISNDFIKVKKYQNGSWVLLKEVKVNTKTSFHKLMVTKKGKYLDCYLNDKLVISDLIINSIGGRKSGMVCNRPMKNSSINFDNFKITGIRK